MSEKSIEISSRYRAPGRQSNHYRAVRFISRFFLHLVLIVGGLAMIFPLIWMIVSSFKPSLEVISVDFHFLPRVWTLRNYVRVFKSFSGPGMNYSGHWLWFTETR